MNWTLYILVEMVVVPQGLAGEVKPEAEGQGRKELELLGLVLDDLRFGLSGVQLGLEMMVIQHLSYLRPP